MYNPLVHVPSLPASTRHSGGSGSKHSVNTDVNNESGITGEVKGVSERSVRRDKSSVDPEKEKAIISCVQESASLSSGLRRSVDKSHRSGIGIFVLAGFLIISGGLAKLSYVNTQKNPLGVNLSTLKPDKKIVKPGEVLGFDFYLDVKNPSSYLHVETIQNVDNLDKNYISSISPQKELTIKRNKQQIIRRIPSGIKPGNYRLRGALIPKSNSEDSDVVKSYESEVFTVTELDIEKRSPSSKKGR